MRRITGTALCLLLLASSALAADKPAKAKDPSQQQQQQPTPPSDPSDPSKGEMIDNAKEYHHCIALARQKPDDGWEEALAWTSLGEANRPAIAPPSP